MLKIGAVSYINALPLFFPIVNRKAIKDTHVEFAPPVLINSLMIKKELDIGMISTACFLRHPDDFQLFCNLGIASTGAVGSVKLFFKKSIRDLDNKIILLSEESETSNLLTQIIATHFWKISPHFIYNSAEASHREGEVVIGDACLKYGLQPHKRSIDLGEEWFKWTGLPFVFAVIAIQKQIDLNKTEGINRFRTQLHRSYEWSMDHPREIIREAQKRTGLDERLLRHYFNHLQFNFQQPHIEGIRLFASYLNTSLNEYPFKAVHPSSYAESLR